MPLTQNFPATLPARAALMLMTLLPLTGCMVGPDYVPPKTDLPDAWSSLNRASTQPSVVNEQVAKLGVWWENFNDPTLNQLIEESIRNNLDLAQAMARLRQARASRAVAFGGLWPSVDLAGSYRRTGSGAEDRSPLSTGSIGTTSGRSNDQYQLGFDAAWEIDIFGGLRRGLEVEDARIVATYADLQDVRITLIAEVAQNYLTMRTAQQRLAIAEKNLALQQRSLGLTQQQVAAGFAARLDLAQAEAQIASTQAQLPALRQAAQTAALDIALLLGRQPGTLMNLLTSSESVPPTPPAVPAGLPSDLLRRRPDIRRAEANLRAATANIGVATADLYPRFSLTGAFGTDDEKPRGLFNWSNAIWSFGPSLSWNIFNAGRIYANIAFAEAQRDESTAFYYQSILIALRDVEAALTAYEFEQQRRKLLATAVDANRRAYTLANQLYAQGQTEFVNVLTAQQSLLSSEDALAQSDANVVGNLIALYKALGGGWEDGMESATP